MSRRDRLCDKCKSAPPCSSDSWCTLCRAIQSLETLARTRSVTPGFRVLAEEIVVQGGRQVQALFELDKRGRSYIDSLNQRLTSASKVKKEVTEAEAKTTLTPKAAAAKPPLPRNSPKKEEPKEPKQPSSSDEESVTEDEAVEPSQASRPEPPTESSPRRGEQEPAGPAPVREEKPRSRSRHRGRRGGTKHQQRFRQLEEPDRKFHRRLQFEKIPLERSRRDNRRPRWER